MPSEPSPPRPARKDNSVAPNHNPTPLDALFIFLAAGTLLLLLLWIVSQFLSPDKFNTLPEWLVGLASNLWAKIALGSGTVLSLIFRRWLVKKPAPNYLVWVPGLMLFMIASLFAVGLLVHWLVVPPPAIIPETITLRLPPPPASIGEVFKIDGRPQMMIVELNPGSYRQIREASGTSNYTVTFSSTFPIPPKGNVVIEANWVRTSSRFSQDNTVDYHICLQPTFKSLYKELKLQVECANGTCQRGEDEAGGLMVMCPSDGEADRLEIPKVYASTLAPISKRPGWVVPSLETLEKMQDRQRLGFTRFEIQYQPSAAARAADSFFYAISVNDQPVYIDNFSPEVLRQGLAADNNVIRFALENLDFSGRNQGSEKIQIVFVFLAQGKEVLRQVLERDYVALRDAPTVELVNGGGRFVWNGTYVRPRIEDRFDVQVSSTRDAQVAMNAKSAFDRLRASYQGTPVVMVIRPPFLGNTYYGLVLGLVQPTSQVKFTFTEDEAVQICRWAKANEELKAKRIVQRDLLLYDESTSRPIAHHQGCG